MARFSDEIIKLESRVFFEAATPEEMKAIGDNLPEGYIAGWASTPDRDYADHIVLPRAFDDSIRARGLNGPKGVKLLVQHDPNRPAGIIRVLETRGERLWIEAQMNLAISYARDFYEAAKSIGGLNFSVGFNRQKWEWVWEQDDDGRDVDEYLVIEKGDLWEVSVVTFPMNENCTMEFIKSADGIGSIADFEKFLVNKGFARSRNHAAELTQVVKQCAGIFAAKKPWLAEAETEKMSGQMAKIRSLIESGI